MRIKTVSLVAVALLATLTASAQFEEPLTWVRQFGTPDQDDARAVYTDGENSYVTGFVAKVVDDMTRYEAYIAKFDARGRRLWFRQFAAGNAVYTFANAITGDDSGVYVAGYGAIAYGKAFVRKFDLDGEELWSREIDSGGGADTAWGIARDDTGVYVVGYTSGSFLGFPPAGGTDCYLLKLSHDGKELLALHQWGSADADYALAVAVDRDGISVAGSTRGQMGEKSLGDSDAFLTRFDLEIRPLWTLQFGSARFDGATAVAADRRRIIVVGSTGGSLTSRPNRGGSDAFVLCLTREGETLWTRAIATRKDDSAGGVAVLDGYVYVAGSTGGVFADQDSSGQSDGFLRAFDKFDGAVDFTVQFGSGGYDTVRALGARAGSLVIAGQLEPGLAEKAAMPRQRALGLGDAFIVRAIIE